MSFIYKIKHNEYKAQRCIIAFVVFLAGLGFSIHSTDNHPSSAKEYGLLSLGIIMIVFGLLIVLVPFYYNGIFNKAERQKSNNAQHAATEGQKLNNEAERQKSNNAQHLATKKVGEPEVKSHKEKTKGEIREINTMHCIKEDEGSKDKTRSRVV